MNVGVAARNRLLSLVILAVAALCILIKSSLMFTYFTQRLNRFDLWMKAASTSFHWSQIAILAINTNDEKMIGELERLKELILIWVVFGIVLLGASILLMSFREKRVLRKLQLCNNPASMDRSLGQSAFGMISSND
jgi:ABC-type transport system involved in multi-copper enzyme maturation permease subunit